MVMMRSKRKKLKWIWTTWTNEQITITWMRNCLSHRESIFCGFCFRFSLLKGLKRANGKVEKEKKNWKQNVEIEKKNVKFCSFDLDCSSYEWIYILNVLYRHIGLVTKTRKSVRLLQRKQIMTKHNLVVVILSFQLMFPGFDSKTSKNMLRSVRSHFHICQKESMFRSSAAAAVAFFSFVSSCEWLSERLHSNGQHGFRCWHTFT